MDNNKVSQDDDQLQWTWLEAAGPLTLAGLCSAVATSLAIYQIIQHLRYYGEPVFQRYIVRIIFLVPMYAILSFFSLIFQKTADMFFDTIRDVYEAWVLYNFLSLCIQYAGGPGPIVSAAEGKVVEPRLLTCTCCIPPLDVTGRFIRRCKIATIQFVYLKPVLAILILLLYKTGEYNEGNFALDQGYLYIQIVYNISYTSALYGLLLFYLGTDEILAPFKPLIKFLLIKIVIFFTFWQGLFLSILGFMEVIPSSQDAKALQNFLICLEMVGSAICMWFAFPFDEYKTAYGRENQGIHSYGGAIGHAISIKDLVSDTVHQFAPVYREYVLYSDTETGLENGANQSRETKRAKRVKTKTFIMLGQEATKLHSNDQSILLANVGGNQRNSLELSVIPENREQENQQAAQVHDQKADQSSSDKSKDSGGSNQSSKGQDWSSVDLDL
eukprot:TRINITY_DN10177_c0_g1_i1.p1 TRINITY_DN10177_c0_g1~~TRINITY_DN10177_c0_g1_i1.p1  ORF type:complete len:464 (-),score=20.47 TRINITY_DN10177_c0_g1_i1:285-1610(-)